MFSDERKSPAPAATPDSSAASPGGKTLAQRLRELDEAHQQGLLNDDEYRAKRKEIIDGH
jgi:hypothetical protein